MSGIQKGCSIIAGLIILTLLIHFDIVYRPLLIIYYLQASNGFAMMLVVMGLLFLTVNLLAAVGMYRMRWWGYVATYTAIVLSSIIFAVSYIPFFEKLFPVRYASLALLIANTAFLFSVIYLQVMSRVRPPRARAVRAKKEVEKVEKVEKVKVKRVGKKR